MICIQHKDNIALITKEKPYKYADLFNKINQFAGLFDNKNYSKVAIHSENREEWVFSFYAAWKNNCTVVPVDFLSSPDDIAYILNDCKPDLVFYSGQTREKVEALKETLDFNLELVNFDDIVLPEAQDSFEWDVPKNADETAVIIYTSGTTGSPKGVMLTYANLLANVNAVSNEVKIFTANRQVLMLLPMHHIFPLAGSMVAPLAVGGTVVMTPSMQSSDILETLKKIR